jgi:integrase/recombinase XerD
MDVASRVRVSGPLTRFRDGFEAELVTQGYTDFSAAQQLRLLARLSNWLEEWGLEPFELDAEATEAFFAARRAAGCATWCSTGGPQPVLSYLRSVGAVPTPAPVVDTSAAGRLLESYRCYLEQERGLVARTVEAYVAVARRFLDAQSSGREHLGLDALVASAVIAFVEVECARPGVRVGVVTALRCLLRYLFFEGLIATELVWVVPAAAGWSEPLPAAVTPAQVDALLGACDRRRGVGRRDYALITVFVRLGLRASEAAGLTLDDFNWRNGEITVRGKGDRVERMPLPGDVGEAIVAYVQRGRPDCQAREVFIRATAPWRRLAQPSVTDIVYRACERAGLPAFGPHRLRHTAATQMLRAGGSLAEIAQVLRHHDPATTATYAKVDRDALTTLAVPWPGASR